ncbi:MAG TPA: imidazole glycerol phosphate synthase subunit HisH [Actinomycetota bacterium]
MTIAVLDYGMGNLRSVARAIEHVGGKPEITEVPATALAADGLVVPGVGHFGACVRALRERGLEDVVRGFASSDRPLFGVCVGMQVLFEGSEEDPDPGLGLFEGLALRLPAEVKVPHMGWNEVRWTAPHPYVRDVPTGTRFYFVHSYAPDAAADVTVGATEHGRPFAAAVARGNVFATQFHPEKSGEPGLRLYEAFVQEATP